jgi:hypothetical protein
MALASSSLFGLVVLIALASALRLDAENHEMAEFPEHDIKIFGKITPPCPAGKTAYKNSVAPTYNGCGSGPTQAKFASYLVPYLKDLTSCCNAHDICFGTCVSSNYDAAFSKCNSDFKSCMYAKCGHKGFIARAACKSTAYTLYTTVQKGGKTFYEKAQKQHCSCKSQPPS